MRSHIGAAAKQIGTSSIVYATSPEPATLKLRKPIGDLPGSEPRTSRKATNMKAPHQNKALNVERATKLRDPQACDPESARTVELVTVLEVSEAGALCRIDRLPAHTVTLDASLLDGQALKVSDRLIVACQRPDDFGFHRGTARAPWRATGIVEVERR